ncbi:MAG: ankyrin repeat domain-containing protein [Alphaproteobacteria bacterium]|nr:ankyrin repeat domain-containing protein [Alphaproteobacteria bacterium]
MQPDSKHGRKAPAVAPERAEFFRALHGGNRDFIDLFLAQHPDAVHWRTPDGTPPLVLAMGAADRDLWEPESRSYNHEDVIELLLAYGADVNATDAQGRTALIEECRLDRRETIINHLLKNNADVNAADYLKTTALHFLAAQDYGDDMIAPLVAAGANMNAQDWQGNTPLHIAAGESAFEFTSGHLDAVQRLLDCGASTDIRNNHFRTPLDSANMNGDFQDDGKRPTAELIAVVAGKQAKRAPKTGDKPDPAPASNSNVKGPKPPPGKFRL